MSSEIDVRLKELITLWTDGTPASLQRVPLLCDKIFLAANLESQMDVDPKLLQRALRLAAAAEDRLATCLAIQSRTGSYSTGGALEHSPHIVTAGWEG
jgi:hypothetical protein